MNHAFHAPLDRRRFLASLVAAPVLSRLVSRRARRQLADHIVVVGAGAFGGWTALALQRTGLFRVTLVDAWGAGHSRASSGGETRVIRTVYGGEQIYTQMAARALVLWREAEQRWRRKIYFETGSLWMFAGDDSYARRSIAPMQAAGLRLDQVTPASLVRRYPLMNFADLQATYWEPSAGYLLARQSCELVRETFVREGGEYRIGRVQPVASRGARLSSLALSDGSTLEGDRFVFAGGPWMAALFPEVIGRRIVATRQEVFFFGLPAAAALDESDSLPVWVHMGERVVYGVPDNERRGLKIADDTAGDEIDPTTIDRTPSAKGLARAREILRERFPTLGNAPLTEARVCQYEASSDGNFLVDRHPGLENVWLVGGGSGHGFKMGPALGEHVAALIQGLAAPHPLFAYKRLRPRPPQE
jgi:glycine/D-amino acid oxidase-like deaminating enzyme